MVSGDLLNTLDYQISDHLKIANTISSEIEYMRTSLLPSLIKNMKDNSGRKNHLKLFEFAKIYEPRAGDLPQELHRLGIVVNTDFDDLKGIISALFQELNIGNILVKSGEHKLMSNAASIYRGDDMIGSFGTLHQKYAEKLNLTEQMYIAEIDFESIIQNYQIQHTFKAPLQYAMVKLDLTVIKKMSYQKMRDISFENSKLLQNIEYVSSFENKISLRFYFSSETKNITENSTPPGLVGLNTSGRTDYVSPCPPDREHRYFFKLYALKTTLDLPAGSTKADLLAVMQAHIIDQAELIGLYQRI